MCIRDRHGADQLLLCTRHHHPPSRTADAQCCEVGESGRGGLWSRRGRVRRADHLARLAAGRTIDEVRPDHCRPFLDTSAVTAPSTFWPPHVTSMVTVTLSSATALTVPTHRTSAPSSSSGTTTGCVNLAE